ncbi:MAG: hypothetical protein NZ959_03925 [Armatimonadetes bacterium]|nr:hypothetical protein [Armatimonadota bacterium]MDW8122372.1 hypothetical protein [Armatimonadota bacterium]
MQFLFWLLILLLTASTFARLSVARHRIATLRTLTLFSLRILVIALFVILFSPVTVSVPISQKEQPRIALVVDDSLTVDPRERSQSVKSLLSKLSPMVQWTIWRFGRELEPVSQPSDWKTSGQPESRLSEALREVCQKVQPDWLILLSDGQDTKPLKDSVILSSLRAKGTRLLWCPLRHRILQNFSVKASPSYQSVFSGETASVVVTVQRTGGTDRTTCRLSLYEGRQRLRSEILALDRGQTVARTWTVAPMKKDWNIVRVEVESVDGWKEDNRTEVAIWKAPTKLRVLLVAFPPSWDFTFVKRALESDTNLEIVSLVGLSEGKFFATGPEHLIPVTDDWTKKFHCLVVFTRGLSNSFPVSPLSIVGFLKRGGGVIWVGPAAQGWNARLFGLPPRMQISDPITGGSAEVVLEDPLGSAVGSVPDWEEGRTIQPLDPSVNIAARHHGKPLLVWWEEGPGRLVFFPASGAWPSVMGQETQKAKVFSSFWQKVVRFVSSPEKEWQGELPQLATGRELPDEWTTPPDGQRLRRLAAATGGATMPVEQMVAFFQKNATTSPQVADITIPLSSLPILYLLLTGLLLLEWWLVRRSGLG